MAGLRDLSKKMRALITLIDNERERDLLLIAKDTKALVANRVQNSGLDSDEKPLPSYSTSGVPAYLLFNAEKPNGAKIGADYKKLDDKYGPLVSYRDRREHYGLPTSKTTLTYTGEMWHGIDVWTASKTADTVTVHIGGTTEESINRLQWNTSRYGDFLQPSAEEEGIIQAAAFERRSKQIKKIFS